MANSSNFPDHLTFHFIKGNHFRVIHCDGVAGAISPDGESLRMTLYSERLPIPLQVTYRVNAEGALTEEIGRESRSGIVREIEVEAVIPLAKAAAIAEWIKAQLEMVQRLKTESAEPPK